MRDFNRKLKIVLIDDNANHLRGIKELITLDSCYEVAGATTSANLGINLVKKHHPDIVLMDINMPEKDGLQAIQAINKLNLSTKIVVLSGYDDSELIYRAMKLGARGYVLKTMASVKLINAIEEVSMGKIYLPAALSTRFFEFFQASSREETTSTPFSHKDLSLLITILRLFGKGRPILSNVLLPITILEFKVTALKCFKSSLKCQGISLLMPITKLSASATISSSDTID